VIGMDIEETWRTVPGWDAYEVSSLGRVRRIGGTPKAHTTRVLKPNTSLPYSQVTLCMRGIKRCTYVHHLVAEAFIGPRPDGCEINHIDTDRRNNRADNLEYLTDAAHKRHSVEHGLVASGARHHMKRRPERVLRGTALPWAKLTEDDIPEIRRLIAAGVSRSDIADRFHISPSLVSYIKHGRIWQHVA
jgi:hypothetical protein